MRPSHLAPPPLAPARPPRRRRCSLTSCPAAAMGRPLLLDPSAPAPEHSYPPSPRPPPRTRQRRGGGRSGCTGTTTTITTSSSNRGPSLNLVRAACGSIRSQNLPTAPLIRRALLARDSCRARSRGLRRTDGGPPLDRRRQSTTVFPADNNSRHNSLPADSLSSGIGIVIRQTLPTRPTATFPPPPPPPPTALRTPPYPGQ